MEDKRYTRLFLNLADWYTDCPKMPISKKACLDALKDDEFDHGYSPIELNNAVTRFVAEWRSLER